MKGASPLWPTNGEVMDKERSIPLAEARYQSAYPSPPLLLNNGGSPVSLGVHSAGNSEAADYAETARLVGSSALSDDGMTPLIRPARTRRQKALHLLQRLLRFFLSHWSKIVILALLITLIVLVSVKGFGFFGNILGWFQRHNGWAGWGIFVGMYTAVVALFMPGVVLILGAGFVFGFWRGLLAVWAGGAVGQALAFLLARYLFHSWVESTLKHKWKKWAIIDKAIEHDGWKLVLIMRFSPIIPYNLLNIAMATTNIPFWQFTLVSAVGIIYECAVFAYFGSMADNIHAIISGEGGPPPVFEWVMLGISLVMCVVGALFVSYSIKQAVKRAQRHLSSAQLEDLGLAEDGEQLLENAEGGQVQMDRTYPASLEREGFVGTTAASATSLHLPSSPEFELKAVGGSTPAAADSNDAATSARGKGSLLGSLGSGLLSVSAGNGSGSLHALSLVAAANNSGAVSRSGSQKQKISPKASYDNMSHRSVNRGEDAANDDNLEPMASRATRRHPSSSGENIV